MTNTNCLAGIRCPQCGNEDRLKIVARIMCVVTDDGSEPIGDHDWDDESFAVCPECERDGPLSEFSEQSTKEGIKMQIISKTKHTVTIQVGSEQVLFFNRFGVAWEKMLDEALNGKTGPKWKKVELADGKTESFLVDFLLTAGATRQHNGRDYVYDFSGVAV